MYGSNVTILAETLLKSGAKLKLSKSVQHRHARLKSGRGTIKTEITYSVYVDSFEIENAVSDYHEILCTTQRRDALNSFKLAAKDDLK